MYCQQVSISSLTGLIIERWIVCILVNFDDSGNKGNSDNPHLTLACLAAHSNKWQPFEIDWREKLKKHNLSYFHANEIFTKMKEDEANAIYDDFVKVIQKHSINYNTGNIIASSCTIRYKGYDAAKIKNPNLRDIELIAFDHCIEVVLPHAWQNENNLLLIDPIFDAKDHCFRKIEGIWEQAEKIEHPFAERFARPKVESSCNVCGLQAADFVAWFLNRYYSKGVNDDWGKRMAMILLLIQLKHVKYDEQDFALKYDSKGHLRKNTPKTKSPIECPKGMILLRQNKLSLWRRLLTRIRSIFG